MTELFTMIVLAANIIVASAFARFAPTAAANVATRMSNLRTPTLSKTGWWQKSGYEMHVAQPRVTSASPPARTGDHRSSKAG